MRMALAIDRDAVLLHDFQQGGVRLGRGAVDFVGQQELREDRAGAEAELLRLHVEDRRAGHVGGHQVGRELNAAELQAQHAAQRPHEQRLAQARHGFDQHVAAGEQGHERPEDQLVLADVDLGDLRGDPVEELLGRRLAAFGGDWRAQERGRRRSRRMGACGVSGGGARAADGERVDGGGSRRRQRAASAAAGGGGGNVRRPGAAVAGRGWLPSPARRPEREQLAGGIVAAGVCGCEAAAPARSRCTADTRPACPRRCAGTLQRPPAAGAVEFDGVGGLRDGDMRT